MSKSWRRYTLHGCGGPFRGKPRTEASGQRNATSYQLIGAMNGQAIATMSCAARAKASPRSLDSAMRFLPKRTWSKKEPECAASRPCAPSKQRPPKNCTGIRRGGQARRHSARGTVPLQFQHKNLPSKGSFTVSTPPLLLLGRPYKGATRPFHQDPGVNSWPSGQIRSQAVRSNSLTHHHSAEHAWGHSRHTALALGLSRGRPMAARPSRLTTLRSRQ